MPLLATISKKFFFRVEQLRQRVGDPGQANLVEMQTDGPLRQLHLATLLQVFRDSTSRGRPTFHRIERELLNQLGFDFGREQVVTLLASPFVDHGVDSAFDELLA